MYHVGGTVICGCIPVVLGLGFQIGILKIWIFLNPDFLNVANVYNLEIYAGHAGIHSGIRGMV